MMTRKQFLRSALDLAAATLGLTVLSACGGTPPHPVPDAGATHPDASPGNNPGAGGDGGGSTDRCVQNGTQSTIGDNHGHVLLVTAQDVAAGAAVTYHIQGTSDHDHTVLLSADDFASLQQNRAIMTTSSFDADHDHSIMVACA